MMVPRSYQFSSHTSASTFAPNEKYVTEVSARERSPVKVTGKKENAGSVNKPPKMLVLPPATPSKPVVIPTRTKNGGHKTNKESVSKGSILDKRVPYETSPIPVTPRQAASDPHPDTPSKPTSGASRRISDAKLRSAPRRSISSASPKSWGTLLSPPEESELRAGSFESTTTVGPSSSIRSLSTESMPSLDTDTESLSSVSNPSTPAFLAAHRSNGDRRQKSISTSVGEDCAIDHPLMPRTSRKPPDVVNDHESGDFTPPRPSPLARSRTYFKSNLTASFRKIRSAAQSISAFTPPVQREDYLARTLLSLDSHFPDERRPLPSPDPPDPALRRYLNPSTFSPAELHFHSEESPQVTRPSCTASIQLQTYQRRNGISDKATSPPVFAAAQQQVLDAVDGFPQLPSPRQREPRENSDFLRVIVLEMNMRKNGKLGDASPGRARLWLPARQAGKVMEDGEGMCEGPRVPNRWVALEA